MKRQILTSLVALSITITFNLESSTNTINSFPYGASCPDISSCSSSTDPKDVSGTLLDVMATSECVYPFSDTTIVLFSASTPSDYQESDYCPYDICPAPEGVLVVIVCLQTNIVLGNIVLLGKQ